MSDKKKVRSKFRNGCYERDKNKCRMCGATAPSGIATEDFLDAHHITDRNLMPNGGYVKENGISLCEACHVKAENFHISNGETWVPGFHPDDLYKKIGSSKEKASKASEDLK